MKPQSLVVAMVVLGGSLVACEDAAQDLSDLPESAGVQEPGSSTVPRGCATTEPSPAEKEAIEARLAAQGDVIALTASHVVPVYVHRIHATNGTGGALTSTQISQEIDILNAAYAP